jgi:hypothetical protein
MASPSSPLGFEADSARIRLEGKTETGGQQLAYIYFEDEPGGALIRLYPLADLTGWFVG